MKNDEKLKIFIFVEKVSESLRKAPGGLRRPRKGLSTLFRAWEPMHEKIEKVHKECFAQHVDGAPSTAPSGDNSAVQRLIVSTTVKWSLHQGSNGVLNKDHEIQEARNKAVSFLT